MKATVHIPIVEYGFVEWELENKEPEDVLAFSSQMLKATQDGFGLNTKEWAQARNQEYREGIHNPEVWEKMSKYQKQIINEIKLARRSQEEK